MQILDYKVMTKNFDSLRFSFLIINQDIKLDKLNGEAAFKVTFQVCSNFYSPLLFCDCHS